MARFDYLEARTLRQALSLWQRHGPNARFVAGSTDFLVRWRMGNWNPDYVINIQHIPALNRVSFSARNGLRLGLSPLSRPWKTIRLCAAATLPLQRRRPPSPESRCATWLPLAETSATPRQPETPSPRSWHSTPNAAPLGLKVSVGYHWTQFFTAPGRRCWDPASCWPN